MLPVSGSLVLQSGRRVWLPLFLLWPFVWFFFLLLCPCLLIWKGIQIIQCKQRVRVFLLVSILYALLTSLRGFVLDVEDKEIRVKVIIN